MKHVRSLQSEPGLLGEYRGLPQSGANRDARYATEVWKRFKTRNPDAYKELRDSLASQQQGLCMYCERLLVEPMSGTLIQDSYLIEHVLPKSGAAGRVLDWRNHALSCWIRYASKQIKTCADRKWHHDLPPRCDPRQLPLIPGLLEVSSEGLLRPNAQHCDAFGLQCQDLEDTISLLNLNAEPLRKKRQIARDMLRQSYTDLLRALLESGADVAAITQAQRDFIASRLQPANGFLKPFWTAERCGLGALAETWIRENASLFQ
jgi:uncharacterized protein (TIGR02646 family)